MQVKAGLLSSHDSRRKGAQLTPAKGPWMMFTGKERGPNVKSVIKMSSHKMDIGALLHKLITQIALLSEIGTKTTRSLYFKPTLSTLNGKIQGLFGDKNDLS